MRNLFCHNSGGWKSERNQGIGWVVPSEICEEGAVPALSLAEDGCLLPVSSHCLPCTHDSVSKLPLFMRTAVILGLGPSTNLILS
jgi:hypothetical protein